MKRIVPAITVIALAIAATAAYGAATAPLISIFNTAPRFSPISARDQVGSDSGRG